MLLHFRDFGLKKNVEKLGVFGVVVMFSLRCDLSWVRFVRIWFTRVSWVVLIITKKNLIIDTVLVILTFKKLIFGVQF